MKKKIRIFLLSALLTFNSQAIAQEFHVSNNAEIKALASKTEITRIAFDSRVSEVHAISEEIEYVIQAQDIYLRMLNEDKPINFFVKCEDENTYKLLLIANDGPADQIFIHNKENVRKTMGKTEYFGDILPELKSRIAKIIEVTLNPSKHLGYKFEKRNRYLSKYFEKIRMKLEELVSDNHLVAEKISITNNTKEQIRLNQLEFLTSKYLAVYLKRNELLPKEQTTLIRIYEK